MLKTIEIATMVTRSGDGMRARPMSTIPAPEKGVIHILTEAQSTAAQDIGRDGTVLLAYTGRGDHLSVAGRAAVNPDKGLVKELWNPGAQVFWPNGLAAALVNFLVALLGHVRGGLCYVLVGGMYLVSGISGAKASGAEAKEVAVVADEDTVVSGMAAVEAEASWIVGSSMRRRSGRSPLT